MNKEQSTELLVDLLHAQRQISSLSQEATELKASLARRSHQMTVLQRVAEILAATPKVAQVAGVVLDVFVQEFGAKKCIVWILEDSGSTYLPRAGYGLPRAEWSQLQLPAPNPFPIAPLLLFQDQWLEPATHGGLLDPLTGPEAPGLYFVPFENQLLLMGFAIIGLEPGRILESDENTLTILQRQVAVSIYNAWLFRDLAEQRDVLRTGSAASSWPSPATSCALRSPASWGSHAWSWTACTRATRTCARCWRTATPPASTSWSSSTTSWTWPRSRAAACRSTWSPGASPACWTRPRASSRPTRASPASS
jgi:hypothetical protein